MYVTFPASPTYTDITILDKAEIPNAEIDNLLVNTTADYGCSIDMESNAGANAYITSTAVTGRRAGIKINNIGADSVSYCLNGSEGGVPYLWLTGDDGVTAATLVTYQNMSVTLPEGMTTYSTDVTFLNNVTMQDPVTVNNGLTMTNFILDLNHTDFQMDSLSTARLDGTIWIRGATGNIATSGTSKININSTGTIQTLSGGIGQVDSGSVWNIATNNWYMTGLDGVVSGTSLLLDSTDGNRLCRDTCSRRYKENIISFKIKSQDILKLPLRYYNHIGASRSGIGYIAEEAVEVGAHGIVAYNSENQPESFANRQFAIYMNENTKKHHIALKFLMEKVEGGKEFWDALWNDEEGPTDERRKPIPADRRR